MALLRGQVLSDLEEKKKRTHTGLILDSEGPVREKKKLATNHNT